MEETVHSSTFYEFPNTLDRFLDLPSFSLKSFTNPSCYFLGMQTLRNVSVSCPFATHWWQNAKDGRVEILYSTQLREEVRAVRGHFSPWFCCNRMWQMVVVQLNLFSAEQIQALCKTSLSRTRVTECITAVNQLRSGMKEDLQFGIRPDRTVTTLSRLNSFMFVLL